MGANGARRCCRAPSASRSGSKGRRSTRLPAANATSRRPAPKAASGLAPPIRFAITIPAIAGASASASRSVARNCTPELQATISAGSAIAPCATAVAGLITESANQKSARPKRVSGFETPISRFTGAGLSSSLASCTPRPITDGSPPPTAPLVPDGWWTVRSRSGGTARAARSSCVATRTEQPPRAWLTRRVITRAADTSSKPSVGSSTSKIVGPCDVVSTSASRRRSPSEQRDAGRLIRSATPSSLASASARATSPGASICASERAPRRRPGSCGT